VKKFFQLFKPFLNRLFKKKLFFKPADLKREKGFLSGFQLSLLLIRLK